MEMNSGRFFDWYHMEASDVEKKLCDKISGYEDYFADMLFSPNSITNSFIAGQSSSDGGKTWDDELADLPDELDGFMYSHFLFCVKEIPVAGQFDTKNQTITIHPDYMNDDSVILHEMIHLHEFVLNEIPTYFRDVLLWCLYKDLRDKIIDLEERIEAHGYIFNENYIGSQGGTHDILFLLKSYDLDLRKGYPLGTVFGYGYAEEE